MKNRFLLTSAILAGVILLLWGGKKVYMQLKQGAEIAGLSVDMRAALEIVGRVFHNSGLTAVLTSGTDSIHGENSYHKQGDAADFRLASRLDRSQNDEDIRRQLQIALGADFDVVLEVDHFHIEFDRRRWALKNALPFRG